MEISVETIEMTGRFLGAGIALGFGGIGAAIGMGMAAGQANEAIMRQPAVQGPMLRTMLIGQAIGGSPSIFALVVGLLILLVPGLRTSGVALMAATIGAGISIGLGCFGSGLGCGWPAGAACDGAARNPRQSTRITQTMIIGQAMAQTPSVFATVVAVILLFVGNAADAPPWAALGLAIGAGLAMGASASGPGIGSGIAARGAVQGVSAWPQTYGQTVRTMLLSQAVCQTPAIFGLLVAFIMLFVLRDLQPDILGFAKVIGAGIAVGFGGMGPGIGSGFAADKGCAATSARPRHGGLILRTMLIGQAVSQSTAIYGLIIALVLLYVVRV